MITSMILFILSHSTFAKISTECIKQTDSCPSDLASWTTRAKDLNCTERYGPGTYYSCLLTAGDDLAETCMFRTEIKAGVTGCPVVSSVCGIYGSGLMPDSQFEKCPGDVTGCPPSNHAGYFSTQLFLYMRCLRRSKDRYIDLNETTPEPTTQIHRVTALSGKDGTSTEGHSPAGAILGGYIGIVIVLIMILVFIGTVYKVGWRLKVRQPFTFDIFNIHQTSSLNTDVEGCAEQPNRNGEDTPFETDETTIPLLQKNSPENRTETCASEVPHEVQESSETGQEVSEAVVEHNHDDKESMVRQFTTYCRKCERERISEYSRWQIHNALKRPIVEKENLITTICDRLDKDRFCCLIGNPGSGKTTLALTILLRYKQKTLEAKVIYLKHIRDFIQMSKFEIRSKNVVVVDNFLGQSNVNQTQIEDLQSVIQELEGLIHTRKVKILICVQSNVWDSINRRVKGFELFTENIVSMTDYPFSPDEKKQILFARCYPPQSSVNEEEKIINIDMLEKQTHVDFLLGEHFLSAYNLFFCLKHFRHLEIKWFSEFEHQLLAMIDGLRSDRNENLRNAYVVLCVVMLRNGNFDSNTFDERLLNEISSAAGMRKPTQKGLKLAIDYLFKCRILCPIVNSRFVEISERCVMEALVKSFASLSLDRFLRLAEANVISEFVHPEIIDDKPKMLDETWIHIQEKDILTLFNRFFRDGDWSVQRVIGNIIRRWPSINSKNIPEISMKNVMSIDEENLTKLKDKERFCHLLYVVTMHEPTAEHQERVLRSLQLDETSTKRLLQIALRCNDVSAVEVCLKSMKPKRISIEDFEELLTDQLVSSPEATSRLLQEYNDIYSDKTCALAHGLVLASIQTENIKSLHIYLKNTVDYFSHDDLPFALIMEEASLCCSLDCLQTIRREMSVLDFTKYLDNMLATAAFAGRMEIVAYLIKEHKSHAFPRKILLHVLVDATSRHDIDTTCLLLKALHSEDNSLDIPTSIAISTEECSYLQNAFINVVRRTITGNIEYFRQTFKGFKLDDHTKRKAIDAAMFWRTDPFTVIDILNGMASDS